jgi:6-phosphofructokinase 1
VIRTLAELEVDGLVCVGGDGSLNTAQQLHGAGVHVVGVPKTIDNDLEATAVTFGFDSAVGCVAEALDRLRTTSDSHKRAMVVEVMGRHAGWIALYGGMAGGADVILIPEIPFTVEAVANAIRQRDAHGETGSLIVVAEGARCRGGREYARRTGSGEYRLGGIAETVARSLHQASGKEVRTMVLGHLQRGGSPSAQDRILGTRFGVKAVELLAEGTYGHMVNVREDRVGSVPLITAVRKMKAVPRNCDVVAAARCVGIRFGDEAESLG